MRKPMLKYLVIFLFMLPFLLKGTQLQAQGNEIIPLTEEHWRFVGNEVERVTHQGKPSLRILGGHAILKDVEFLNGIIEFNIAFTGERGFMGATWRMQDRSNLEFFYLRPHQSGKPDANQYTPEFNGLTGWQLYYGEGFASPVEYNIPGWNRIRIAVSGDQAEVYINDMEKPAVFIPDLKRETKAGMVSLHTGNFVSGYYSDVVVKPMEQIKLKGSGEYPHKKIENIIPAWEVSANFPDSVLKNNAWIDKDFVESLSWQTLETEADGLANLAMVQGLGDGKNTAFARVVIDSDREQVKKLSFGFSDIARIYLNRQLLYSGSNIYRSRDYRYLGTIGYFDDVYLRLHEGENILLIAVTENFGGWGLQAKFDGMNGIHIGK